MSGAYHITCDECLRGHFNSDDQWIECAKFSGAAALLPQRAGAPGNAFKTAIANQHSGRYRGGLGRVRSASVQKPIRHVRRQCWPCRSGSKKRRQSGHAVLGAAVEPRAHAAVFLWAITKKPWEGKGAPRAIGGRLMARANATLPRLRWRADDRAHRQ